MNTLTLKIPQALDDALQLASARRQMSKSAVVREALEKTLAAELTQVSPSVSWINKWRGAMAGAVPFAPGDDRLAHLLRKHLH